MLIIAVSLGLGLGVAMVPDALKELPKTIQNIFGSAITVSGLAAIILNLCLPARVQVKPSEPEGETTVALEPKA